MSWPVWVWRRITMLVPVDRWVGKNVITALGSFTVLMLLLPVALILRDWGFGGTQRFSLAAAAIVLMALSVAAGIGLSIMPGDPLSYGRAFGTHAHPRTRREARRGTTMSIAPQLLNRPHTTVQHSRIYMVTFSLQSWLLRDTTAIDKELQRLPNWSHWINNTWLISTYEAADVLYARMHDCFLETDRLLIAPLDVQSGFAGWLPQEAWDWIEENKGL